MVLIPKEFHATIFNWLSSIWSYIISTSYSILLKAVLFLEFWTFAPSERIDPAVILVCRSSAMVLRGVFFVVVLPWSPKLARPGYSQTFSLGFSMWARPPNIFCQGRYVASPLFSWGQLPLLDSGDSLYSLPSDCPRSSRWLLLRSIAIPCKIISSKSYTFYLCRTSCLAVTIQLTLTYFILSNITSTSRISSSPRLRFTNNLA